MSQPEARSCLPSLRQPHACRPCHRSSLCARRARLGVGFATLLAAWCAAGCRDLRADPGFCAHCPNDPGPRTRDAQAVTAIPAAVNSDDAGAAGIASGADARPDSAAGGTMSVASDAGLMTGRAGGGGTPSPPDAQVDAQVLDARANQPPPEPCAGACSGRMAVCLAGSNTCVQCAEGHSEACTRDTAVCDLTTHACVQCTMSNHSACHGDTPVCDAATKRCVQCTATETQACVGTAPVCDPGSHSCVQCLASNLSACSAATPVCNAQTHTCAQCNPGELGACPAETSVCEPTSHSCVQCVANSDCPVELARCDRATHRCDGCMQDAVCRRFAERPLCDVMSGACVACTKATEAERCGAAACVAESHICSSHPKNSLSPCAACDSSEDCASGLLCLPHSIGGQNLGNFCFPQGTTAGCGDTNPDARPYSRASQAAAADGTNISYCVPNVSCRALADATSQKDCLNASLPENTACGDRQLNDGVCDARGKCTYHCANASDCPSLNLPYCSGAPGAVCEPMPAPMPAPSPAPAP